MTQYEDSVVDCKQSTMHWLSISGYDSSNFCPQHLGIRVTKENTTQSNTE